MNSIVNIKNVDMPNVAVLEWEGKEAHLLK